MEPSKGMKTMQYPLVRSRRKSIGIHIDSDGFVTIRAPLKASEKRINDFVALQSQWIQKNVAQMQLHAEKRAKFQITYGSDLFYRGARYPIVPCESPVASFNGKQFCFPLHLSPEEIKAEAIRLYRKLAAEYLVARTGYFSQKLDISTEKVTITNAATRWGSNSKRRRIHYSWMLIMAPDSSIDYVIIHELGHCLYPNHSPAFWEYVQRHDPTMVQDKQALRDLTFQLRDQAWTI
jgi:predicted metal-dependent hydrolase